MSKMFGEAAGGFRVRRPPLGGYAGDMLWLVSVWGVDKSSIDQKSILLMSGSTPAANSLSFAQHTVDGARSLMERES